MRLRAPVTDARHEDILELEPLLRPGRAGTGQGPGHGRRPGPGGAGQGDRRPRAAGRRGGRPYAIVTARNRVTSLARGEERSRPTGRGWSTPASPSFRVGTGGADQLWVQLVGRGESPFQVRTGQQATFTGRMVPNPPGFAHRVGMVPEEGAAVAGRQGHHIEVAYAGITLEP